MLQIGLTGGIGSGKSTVSARWRDAGAVVVDADRIAREVVEPGTRGLTEIAERFGDGVLNSDGSLDRAAMANLVFHDDQALKDLEAITHPRIMERSRQLLDDAPPEAVVVHDLPLLVEMDRAPDYALVVVVGVEEEERIRRLVRDRGMAEDAARARIIAQAGEDELRAAADVWVSNESSIDDLHARVDALWTDRLVPFEQALRAGTPPAGPSAGHWAGHWAGGEDPDWAGRAARCLMRLDRALLGAARTLHHTGDSSVPGLPVTSPLELQVGVDDLGGLDDPAVREELTRRGLIVLPAADAAQERLIRSADPLAPVDVHVRVVGSPGWRETLLVRDWLIAEPEQRQDLARRLSGGAAPAQARERWWDQARSTAGTWAESTGWQPRPF